MISEMTSAEEVCGSSRKPFRVVLVEKRATRGGENGEEKGRGPGYLYSG